MAAIGQLAQAGATGAAASLIVNRVWADTGRRPASNLIEAHLLTQERIRWFVRGAVVSIYRDMGAYNESNVDYFVDAITPIVYAGQRKSMEATEAFVTRRVKKAVVREVLNVASDRFYAQARNGSKLIEVYRRPFVTVWSALERGEPYEAAVNAGEARAGSTAEMDVQLAHRATYAEIQEGSPQIKGYRRVANAGACDFCALVDGAFVKSADAMPLHNRCGCGLDPMLREIEVSSIPDGVAVHEHGELGPVLADPAHDFTTESEI
jgi:hypothetical protein